MKYFIGLDLGTTTVKATVYDDAGKPCGSHSVERILICEKEGYYEQDADTWYTDSCKVIKEAVKDIDKNCVKGISVSSQGITTVAVDEAFNPLCNAINWMDTRPVDSWKEFLDKATLQYVRNTTGFPVGYKIPKGIAKVMWVRDNMPEVYSKARYFLMPQSFVIARFTGVAVTDPTMAAGSLVYSNKENRYDDALIEAAGVDKKLFPEIKPIGSFVGKITKKAAEDCGLTVDCDFILGGQDQKVAAFGADLKENEMACSMGTSSALEMVSDNSDYSYRSDMFKVCPYKDNCFVFETVIKTAGGALRWLRDTVCVGLDFVQMDKEAAVSPKGANGTVFVPYLGGSPDGEKNGSFNNIGLHTSRGDMIRSVYEGIAFELRRLIDEADIACKHIKIYSGGSKSKILCQAISDITGLKVTAYGHSEMGSFGAARLASQGTINDGCVKDVNVYYPENNGIYNELYDKYIKYVKG